MNSQPLSEAEFDRLADVLKHFGGKWGMNLEMIDGFFAALICGPDHVPPSEYLPEVWGGGMIDEPVFESKALLQDFMSMLMRHSNAVSRTLQSGDVYLPLLLEAENGMAHANDWANGFMRGMEMRRDGWLPLMEDEEQAGSLIPIFALAHEHDPDPELRSYKEPISAEMRERLIISAAASVMAIHRYFKADKVSLARRHTVTSFRREAPKVGRNEPCPCGSGKKFKYCCAKATLH